MHVVSFVPKGASAVAKPAAAEESVLTASKQREMRDLFRDLDEDWSSSDGTAKANEDEVRPSNSHRVNDSLTVYVYM